MQTEPRPQSATRELDSDPMPPTLRTFTRADLGAVHRLILDTIDASYGVDYPPRAVAFFKAFHAEADILNRSRIGTVLVAETGGAVVATGSLVEGQIFGVFVHPDHQGSGLGRAVMLALEQAASTAGQTESVLSVSLPSRRFYERLGYEMVEPRSRDVGEGQRLDYWSARKALTPAGG